MPEIITIVFDCHASLASHGADSSMVDAPRECEEAQEELIDYLTKNHISYYIEEYVTPDELSARQDQFDKKGVLERVS